MGRLELRARPGRGLRPGRSLARPGRLRIAGGLAVCCGVTLMETRKWERRRTASLWRVWNEHRLMRKLEKKRRMEQRIDDIIAQACRGDAAGESFVARRVG